jgi:trk system potassium uptake protein TrkH
MLRRFPDLPLLVILMGIAALAMFLPAIHALILRDYFVSRPFFYGGTVLLALTIMIAIATSDRRLGDVARSNLVVLAGAYAVLPFMLALPFHQALRDTTFLNAWFEMVSSLTTTGASVYDPPARLAPTLHLWRGLVGWMGGLFILVVAMAILAPMNLGGAEVISGRSPGGGRNDLQTGDPSERMKRQFLIVFPAYLGLTLILCALLTLSGDTGFIALCHAMATMSSSGISPVGGLAGSASGRTGEMLIFLFMVFAVTRRALPGSEQLNQAPTFRQDPEVRMALFVVGLVTLIMILRHWVWLLEPDPMKGVSGVLHAIWGAMFTSLSFLTTNGLVSQDWEQARFWSGLGAPGLMLAGLAMMGGGIATTAGGVKLLRVYALIRHGERQLARQIFPSSIGGAGKEARRLRRQGAYLSWIFFILFGLSIGTVCAALTLTGQSFEPALLFSVAALTNTGPLTAFGGGLGYGYADLDGVAKVVIAVAMVVGRLETLAILTLFSTDRWRTWQ